MFLNQQFFYSVILIETIYIRIFSLTRKKCAALKSICLRLQKCMHELDRSWSDLKTKALRHFKVDTVLKYT